MLKAWNTGHPGGVATVHANSARAGLTRLEQLAGEAASNVPTDLIAEAVHIVVFVEGRGDARRVAEVCEVMGRVDGEWHLQDLLARGRRRFALVANHPPADATVVPFPASITNPQHGDRP